MDTGSESDLDRLIWWQLAAPSRRNPLLRFWQRWRAREGERDWEREMERERERNKGGRCHRKPLKQCSTNQQLPAAGSSAHISVTHLCTHTHTSTNTHTYTPRLLSQGKKHRLQFKMILTAILLAEVSQNEGYQDPHMLLSRNHCQTQPVDRC